MTSTSDPTEPMHVLGLKVENYLKLKLVELQPKAEGLTVISGQNAQGKSSVLSAIDVALRGAACAPERPIRSGEEKASIELLVGPDATPTVRVRRTFTPNGTYLKVEEIDGTPIARPQDALDRLYGAVAFNPLDFAFPPGCKTDEQRDKRRVEMLLERVDLGFDLAAHDAERARLYAERTAQNKVAEQAAALAADGVQLQDLGEMEDEGAAARAVQAAEASAGSAARAKKRAQEIAAEIDELEQKVVRLRAALDEQMKIAGAPVVDPGPLQANLNALRERNSRRRQQAEQAARADERRKSADSAKARADALTRLLTEMDERRTTALSKAAFPVKAIQIQPDGRVWIRSAKDGTTVPFGQASSAQKLLASFAVMASRSPKLRTALIPDGNALDAQGLEVLANVAAKYRYQLFVERIVPDADGAIVMVAGEVEKAVTP